MIVGEYKGFKIKEWHPTKEESRLVVEQKNGFCSDCHGFSHCMGDTISEIHGAIEQLIVSVCKSLGIDEKNAIDIIKDI